MDPPAEKASFERNGYLVVDDFLSEPELAAHCDEIERLHVLAARLKATGDDRVRFFQWEPFSRVDEDDDRPVLRKIEQTRLFSDAFKRLAAHPTMVKTVQKLIGEDLLLFRSTLMLKPAHHGSAPSTRTRHTGRWTPPPSSP